MKAFYIDLSICNGCYCCQIACKDEHVGNDWTPYAKPQPDTGQFWLKLTEHIRGTVPKVKMHYMPLLCNHCDNPACLAACPVEGAITKRADGLVIIHPEKCSGCKACVDACPYHAIYFNEGLNIAQKCTGCAHLLDNGWSEPRCVDVCPNEALRFGEEADLKKLIDGAQVLKPETGSKPRVYYHGIPKKFVAGTVYDPVKKEIVEEARCTLTCAASQAKAETRTDGFGDFWFEAVEVGTYTLSIQAKGFAEKTIADISTVNDVNLGDIPLGS
jgi:Fe-S-cluster-containing dehydrogenase component